MSGGQSGGIAQSDFNDQEILDKTRQENAANGAFRFHYVLPSGRTICSEWVSPDNRRGAAMAWCEAVRAQMAADVRAILEEKVGTGPRKKASPIIVPEGTTEHPLDNKNLPAARDTVTQSTEEPDVDLYLTARLEKAKARIEVTRNALQLAEHDHMQATAELGKIRKLVAALAAGD